MLYIFIEVHRNALKKSEKIGDERGLGQVRTKYLLAHTIPHKIFGTKWSDPVKLEREKKFGMCFAFFLTAIGKV